MATATANNIQIIGGVDTHQDLHTAAIVDLEGAVLGDESFSTTRAGYRAMLRWFRSHGELLRVGVESTGTYGAGITRHLALSGIPVLEVTGPDPASRRAKGKDDTLDAIAAAEAARTRRRAQVAKDRSGAVEALRVLRTTRKTAIKCRRAALQQLHNTIIAAPEEVRDQVRKLTRMGRLRTCAVGCSPVPRGLPLISGGSASTSSLSRPAQASLAFGPQGRSTAQGGLCHRASVPPVTRQDRLSATRSNRQLSGWILPPLVLRAVGAHRDIRVNLSHKR